MLLDTVLGITLVGSFLGGYLVLACIAFHQAIKAFKNKPIKSKRKRK